MGVGLWGKRCVERLKRWHLARPKTAERERKRDRDIASERAREREREREKERERERRREGKRVREREKWVHISRRFVPTSHRAKRTLY